MSQIVVTPRHGRTCPGCNGSSACWVCLGKGELTSKAGSRPAPCHRCSGTGFCPEQASPAEVSDQRAIA